MTMLRTAVVQNLVTTIVRRQQDIIGPIAFEQARKVSGLRVDGEGNVVVEVGQDKLGSVLPDLVNAYRELFGRASVLACKDAVKELQPSVPADELPDILR